MRFLHATFAVAILLLAVPGRAHALAVHDGLRWPNGRIPYDRPGWMPDWQWANFQAAFAQFNRSQRVRFVPRTASDQSWLAFSATQGGSDYWDPYSKIYTLSGYGCKPGLNLMAVIVQQEAYPVGSILYALGLQIGFVPEINRTLRDSYINVFPDNRHPRITRAELMSTYPYEGSGYDILSFMHPPSTYGGRAPGVITFALKNGAQIPAKNALDPTDLEWVDYLYARTRPNGYPLLGDIDGDGKQDRVCFERATASWKYCGSTVGARDGLVPNWPQGQRWGSGGLVPMLGDIDGDRIADRVTFDPATGKWWFMRRNGGPANLPNWPQGQVWGGPTMTPFLADVDGDGVADRVLFDRANGAWWFLRYNGGGANLPNWPNGQGWGTGAVLMMLADIDGDRSADRVAFDPAVARWWFVRRSGGVADLPNWPNGHWWGVGTWTPMLADIDGDGAADRVVFNPADATWRFMRRNGATGDIYPNWPYGHAWGVGGWWPLLGDVDGDGRADRVLFDPDRGQVSNIGHANWYSYGSASAGNPLPWWPQGSPIPAPW